MTPWTVAQQAPLSMGFSGPEDWSGLPFLSPGDLLGPGIEPRSPTWQAGSLRSEPPPAALEGGIFSAGSAGQHYLELWPLGNVRDTCSKQDMKDGEGLDRW